MQKDQAQMVVREETGYITPKQLSVAEKNTNQLEAEAETLNQRQKLHQKQLDVKDEDLVDSVAVDRAEIDKIDNNIKNKQTIRDAIKAGANCVKRGT